MTRTGKIFAAASAIALLAGVGSASAQGYSTSNVYAKGFGGFTLPSGDDASVYGPDSTSEYYKLDYDTGYTIGAAIGYSIRPDIAVELEYGYRNADSKSSINGHTSSNAVMANAIYKFGGMDATGKITPYVGAGLGWANVDVATNDYGSFTRNSAFGYQFIGGVSYAATPKMDLLGEVRYFGTDSGSLKGPNDLKIDAGFETVDFLVGVAYKF